MRLGQLTILACSLLLASSATWAAPATTSGSVALALAGVVAPYSPLPAKEKKAVAAFLGGDSNVPITRKITVTADKVVCRASNVDITSRSCELSFGSKTHTVRGSEANAMFATVALAGVPPDGARGHDLRGAVETVLHAGSEGDQGQGRRRRRLQLRARELAPLNLPAGRRPASPRHGARFPPAAP
ncbi:hypothetical protein ACVIHI_007666 [Bradyrhizobium sp. USDA 4524]